MDVVLYAFKNVILPVEIVGGSILNIIALSIWCFGPKSKQLQCAVYFATLSMIDTVLLAFPGVVLIFILFDKASLPTETAFCKLHSFSSHFLLHCSNWIVAATTIDRTLTVLFPFTFRAKKIRMRSIKIIAAIISIVALAQFPRFIMSEKSTIFCAINEKYRDFVLWYSLVWDMTVCLLLPFTAVISCNVASVVVSFKRRGKQRNVSNSRLLNSTNVFSKLVIGTGVTFILANTLWVFCKIAEITKFDFLLLEAGSATHTVGNILVYFNNFMNPIIYCMLTTTARDDIKHAIHVMTRACHIHKTTIDLQRNTTENRQSERPPVYLISRQ